MKSHSSWYSLYLTMARAIVQLESLELRLCLDAGAIDNSFADAAEPIRPTPEYQDLTDAAIVAHLPMCDGRFMASGRLSNSDPYIARFMPDGTVDPSFPVATLLEQFKARKFTPAGYGLTSDEKLLIYGTRFGGDVNTPIMLRLTHRGKIDHTFGHNGVARIPLQTPGSLFVLPDDRMVLTGNIINNVDPEPGDDVTEAMHGIAILKPSGRPDTRFDHDGVVETIHTTSVNDSLYPTSEGIGSEKIFPLSGERLLYLRGMDFSETFWDSSDRNRGTQQYGDIAAQVFNMDGTIDNSFIFDRAFIDALLPNESGLHADFAPDYAGRYLAGGAEQLPNGSVQIAFTIDTVPIDAQQYPEEHTAKLNAYTATIQPDGKLSTPVLLAADYLSPHPMFLRDDFGNVLLADEHGTFTRYHPDGSRDPSFH
jgi:hypothetical protein